MKLILLVCFLFSVTGFAAMETHSSKSEVHTLRLMPGEDPRAELHKFFMRQKLSSAAIVSAVGSLSNTVLRYSNQTATNTLEGPREVVSLSGTLSLNGPHIHVSVADEKGIVVGGHLVEGSKVFTTLEIVLLSFPEIVFERKKDAKTTFDELTIRKK